MSLSEEERRVIVNLEIEKSYRLFDAAGIMIHAEHWESAANRMYYALFHAVTALLIHDGHNVNTHKGSHALFGLHYIKTGKLPQKYSALYQKLEAIRDEGDYNWSYSVEADDIMQKVAPAKEMIDTIAAMVKE